MFCIPVILCVLNCITDNIQVTEGCIYNPWGPMGLLLPALVNNNCFYVVVTNSSALNSQICSYYDFCPSFREGKGV